MQLQPAPHKTKGRVFELLQALFVDDQAVLASTREELALAASELRLHLKRFGLLMHVGEKNPDGTWTKSKTEAIFFPATPQPEQATPQPAVFPDGRHRVEHTDSFKHLGCQLTPNLTDHTEIRKRMRQARNQVGALTTFFRTPAELSVKKMIFQSTPLNTALCGCESWTLPCELKNELESFQHTGLRRLLDINMYHVQHFRMRNEHVRNKLQVPHILETMRHRQFRFIGKIARLPDAHLQRKFLNAWIHHPRPRGRPKKSLRHAHIETLQEILGPEIDRTGQLEQWLPHAQNKPSWNRIATDWLSARQRETFETHGEHPMLGPPGES